jgi:hypothetical protein
MTPKTYKTIPTLARIYTVMLILFAIVLIMMLYGLTASIIQNIQQASQLVLTPVQVLAALAPLLFLGTIIVLTILAGMVFLLTANITVHTSKHGFRVQTVISQSGWLDWDQVIKVRSFTFREGNQITQMGVAGLHWMFKLNGLLFWMFPHGAIVIGEKNMQEGHKLLRTFKQKRPELFN